MRMLVLLSLLVVACGPKGPSAAETLPRLREAIYGTVTTDEENRANSDLVEQVAELGHLLGLTRLEVEQHLGKGDVCSLHELCAKQGFLDTDWYYEVGHGDTYQRVRPALIVGFDRFGKVVRTYNLRVE